MRVITVDPVSDPRWDALRKAPGAGLFHSPAWIASVRDAYGFEPRASLALDSRGAPSGGVAWCVIDDPLGKRLVSLPFSDTCNPLLLDPAAWSPLREALGAHQLPVSLRCLGESLPADDPDFQVVKRARWHTLEVAESASVLRARFSPATRRGLARAEQAGVELRPLGGAEGLAGFIGLHTRLRKRKYRMLAQPEAFFAAIARRFGVVDGWHSLGAWQGERLLAATIYLRSGDTLYYKFNASDQDALDLRPNNLLVWGGILLAQSLGCRALDLGPSDDDQPGLIRFKSGFGAAERELRFLRWSPPGCSAGGDAELRTALGTVTRLLTAPAVSDEVTAAAGQTLYRLFA